MVFQSVFLLSFIFIFPVDFHIVSKVAVIVLLQNHPVQVGLHPR